MRQTDRPSWKPADPRRPLPKKQSRDPSLAPIFTGKCGAGRQWNVAANNPVATDHAVFPIEQVHRAAHASGAPRRLAK